METLRVAGASRDARRAGRAGGRRFVAPTATSGSRHKMSSSRPALDPIPKLPPFAATRPADHPICIPSSTSISRTWKTARRSWSGWATPAPDRLRARRDLSMPAGRRRQRWIPVPHQPSEPVIFRASASSATTSSRTDMASAARSPEDRVEGPPLIRRRRRTSLPPALYASAAWRGEGTAAAARGRSRRGGRERRRGHGFSTDFSLDRPSGFRRRRSASRRAWRGRNGSPASFAGLIFQYSLTSDVVSNGGRNADYDARYIAARGAKDAVSTTKALAIPEGA